MPTQVLVSSLGLFVAAACVSLGASRVPTAGAVPHTRAVVTTVDDWGWENPLPQGELLHAVSCVSATLCKAVGAMGTILSWDGTQWSADSSGTTVGLVGVSCPTSTFCKAVGGGGVILSWNGAAWTADTSGTTLPFAAVSCAATTLCKAVGYGGMIVSWNGASWAAESSGTGLWI